VHEDALARVNRTRDALGCSGGVGEQQRIVEVVEARLQEGPRCVGGGVAPQQQQAAQRGRQLQLGREGGRRGCIAGGTTRSVSPPG
jgi:hypothetical protein